MFAVIKVGSTQIKVAEGDNISVSRLKDEVGKEISIEKVLLLIKGEETQIGQPFVKNAKVTAKVVRNMSAAKVVAFKFRKRKNSESIKASRHKLTLLNITKISG